MRDQKLLTQRSIAFICILTAAVYCNFSLPIFVQEAQAQNVFERVNRMFSGSRKDGNASGRSRGGATRSQCSQIDTKTLTALVPEDHGGLTTQEYPKLLFYVPFGGNSQSPPAKLRLLDEQKKSVLKEPLLLSLPKEKGIVSVNLPTTEQGLSIGKKYYWYFNVTCINEKGLNTNISINGWIERVEASAEIKKIKQEGNQQEYKPYVDNNIWYETVSQLANNREVYTQEWTSLLSLFQLEEFAKSPVYELERQKQSIGD
ncbi:MAG: DUF928 domain-containing protein [Nostocales cyanobacterium]|nr:MAG: DUF928 domain-containing protein [Nostocales cyanobacterium]TAF20186.1 MAG: DUF928 domain-containing protein [Nostocales cyanobacterium]